MSLIIACTGITIKYEVKMKKIYFTTLFLLFVSLQVLARPTVIKQPATNSTEYFGYWGGYFNRTTAIALENTPPYVDIVSLAFGCPFGDTLTLMFLCSQFTEDEMLAQVKKLQARGQKVVLSIIDTPTTNWNNIDINIFAESVKNIAIDQWGLDGIDIDGESSMDDSDYAPSFIELVTAVRKAIGPNKLLSFTCYTGSDDDAKILAATGQYLNSVNLMAYFDNMDDMTNLYYTYAKWFDPTQIRIGVKAGMTPLDEVANLSKWQPQNNTKGGMMLWTLGQDSSFVTGQPNGTWANTIEKNLRNSSMLNVAAE